MNLKFYLKMKIIQPILYRSFYKYFFYRTNSNNNYFCQHSRKGDSFDAISRLIYKAYTTDSEPKKNAKMAQIEDFMKYLIDKNPSTIPSNEHWESYWQVSIHY